MGPGRLRIGASLGDPTGHAIDPARDLGPRIAHALLPVSGKGDGNGGGNGRCVRVPIVGPLAGGFAHVSL